jgi:rRNA maturation RNase YbeY
MILNRQRTVRIARPALESFLRRIRHYLRLGKAEVSIAFVTDAEIARLNRAYRKKRGPTDVLSFPSIAHRKPIRLSVTQALLPVPTSTPPSRILGSTSSTSVKNCHPDRSDPAFSSTRFVRAASRSGGTVAKSRQAQPTVSAASPNVAASFRSGRFSPPTSRTHAPFLGDIAISPQTARRNAQSAGRPLTTELRILMLHGVLHLLGYDHETDTGQMDRLEQKLRQELGLA